MTKRMRPMRLVASAVLLGGLVWGTFWGQDDHFPFGPFRMYSTTDKIDGDIRSLKFEGTTVTGETIEIPSGHFGLRRAEADGQVPSVRADHSFLRHFVDAYETRNPDAPSLVKLRMFHGIDILEGRRPVGYREEDIAVWERP